MRIAAVVLSFFGAWWWSVGIWASSATPLLYGVAILMSAFIIGAAFREQPRAIAFGERRHVGRAVAVASSLEGAAILAAFNVIPAMQSTEFSLSVQAIIVGLHFVLLGRWLQARPYYITAALLVGLGATGFAISDGALHIRYVCLGGACALWLPYTVAMFRFGYSRCVNVPSGRTCA